MATKLTNLEVKEISFCKNGAQPNAKIEIYKSIDPVETVTQGDGSRLEKMLDKIMKALKIEKEQTQEKIIKGIFTENWQAKELKSSFYDIFWTLDDTVWQIMNDPEITDKATKIKEAITEFAAVAVANLPQDVKKYMDIRESLFTPVKVQISKALEPVKKETEGGTEEMNEEQIKKMIEDITKSVTESLAAKLPEVVKSLVTEEVKPLQDQVGKVAEKIEEIGKIAPGSNKLEGQEENVVKTDPNDFWSNVL